MAEFKIERPGPPPLGKNAAPAQETSQQRRARLEETAGQLETFFFEHMVKAMKNTIPDSGLLTGFAGKSTLNAMLDERLAAVLEESQGLGLKEKLLEQMLKREQGMDGAEKAPELTDHAFHLSPPKEDFAIRAEKQGLPLENTSNKPGRNKP